MNILNEDNIKAVHIFHLSNSEIIKQFAANSDLWHEKVLQALVYEDMIIITKLPLGGTVGH